MNAQQRIDQDIIKVKWSFQIFVGSCFHFIITLSFLYAFNETDGKWKKQTHIRDTFAFLTAFNGQTLQKYP